MRRTFPRLLVVLLVAALGAAACESPTTGGGPDPAQQAQIGFSLDLSGLPVATLAVTVTAGDIATPLVFNIPVVNGTATGTITVPAGQDRLITVRAFDAQGTVTHEGSAAVGQVNPGANMSVTITLLPRSGNVPIVIQMGSMVMTVTRLTPTPAGGDHVGDSIRFSAQVTHPDGSPVAGAVVRWASTNPAIATVDSTGLVVARVAGSADIVATYNGFGATQTLTFTAGNPPPPPDQTAPALVGLNISPDAVTLDSATSSASVSIAVTADDAGQGFYSLYVVLQAADGTVRSCGDTGTPSPGRATRTCSVTFFGDGPAGQWTVQTLTIADIAGNSRSYNAAELAASGFENSVSVTGPAPGPGPDTQAPVLTNAGFTPDVVNVSTGSTQVTLRIVATDEGSGIALVEVSGSHASGGYSFSSGTGGAVKVGDAWETYLAVDGESPPDGFVYLDSVRITDHAGNVLVLNAAALDSLGLRAALQVEHGVILEP